MHFRLKLPPSATLQQRLTYPFARYFFYFFFTYLPYAPIRRINKPKLKGSYIWACSHSNFMCDCVPAAYEGEIPTKFLGKSTLFRFPTKWFVEYCNALPVARAEDSGEGERLSRFAQNRATFKAAIAAMRGGWPVAIFPEGVSIERPGLVLPLKSGVAKLAFSAEEANGFTLGLRIIPVGLEYGSRTRVGSGLNIRYGKPLVMADYRERYLADSDRAVKDLMADLTREMVANFPHFIDESKLALGKELVALGFMRNKFEAAQLFLRERENKIFWDNLDKRRKAFVEVSNENRIPVPYWGHWQAWRHFNFAQRFSRVFWIFIGIPVFLFDLLNNSLSEFFLASGSDFLSTDETETMSLRFILSPLVLVTTYALQFWFLREFVFRKELADVGLGFFLFYVIASCLVWYAAVRWRRQVKRIASLFFFKRLEKNKRAEAVKKFEELRRYLSKL